MMIDKIGGVGPSYGPKKTSPTEKTDKPTRSGDSVAISDEASRAATAARTTRAALASEDPARAERLQQIKQKMQAGEYDNLSDEQLGKIADRLITGVIDQ